MATSSDHQQSPIHMSDDRDDDYYDDISQQGTLQRAESPHQYSSVDDHDKDASLFKRFKRQVSGKEKKELKRQNKELRQKLHKRETQLMVISKIFMECPIFVNIGVKNAQYGDGNKIISDEDMKTMLENLTKTVNEILKGRADIDAQLRDTKRVLEEMVIALKEYRDDVENRSATDSIKMDELKSILNSFVPDLQSVDRVMNECVTALIEYDRGKRKTKQKGFSDMPVKAQIGIRRLVIKFGSLQWPEFCEIMGVGVAEGQEQPGSARNQNPFQSDRRYLDKETCANFMMDWVKTPANTAARLVQIISDYEIKQSEEMKQLIEAELSKQIIPQPLEDTHVPEMPTMSRHFHSTESCPALTEVLKVTIEPIRRDIREMAIQIDRLCEGNLNPDQMT